MTNPKHPAPRISGVVIHEPDYGINAVLAAIDAKWEARTKALEDRIVALESTVRALQKYVETSVVVIRKLAEGA